MSSVKIRLVKCPKCWNVLPESVDVPVYRCGGCGKILQAKCRQQQEQEQEQDGEKSEMQKGGEDKASGSSRSEEHELLQPTDIDELNIPHGVTTAEANSHVLVVEEQINHHTTPIFESSSNNVDEQGEEESSQQTEAPPFFQRIMSGSTDYLDPCSTFSDMLSETCNSPSIHQYGYDASLSCFDTREDDRRFLSRRRMRENKNGVFPANGNYGSSGYVEDSYHKRISSFNLPPPPRPRLLPLLYQSGGNGYDDGGRGRGSPSEKVPPKNYRRHSMMSSYNNKPPVSPDEEKMKLLKIVYQLEEQLKKTCSFQVNSGKHSPPPPTTSRSHELDDPQTRRQHWNRDHYLRIPFSAEVARSGFPLPHDRQHSEPLPPPPYKKDIHRSSRTGGSYSSWPSSPVAQSSLLFSPWEEDPSYGFLKMKMQTVSNLQKKKKKKHLRPIARAAPFIACKKCSEFLLLPEDFLLYKERCHRVRCGGCSIVMRFSLENRTYLVPYNEDEDDLELDFRAPAPPPSEADESSSVNMTSSNSTSRGKIRTYSELVPGTSRTSSPHHSLMGYSTVNQVCKGFGPSSDNGATSSMQKR